MGTAPDFAPMEFKNVGAKGVEYVGSDIELGKYIAEKLGVELEIKAMEFSAIQQGLASGTIDMGISGFAYTEERAETLGLSDRYNIQSEDKGHTLLVLKEDAASYKTAEDFSGKKVVAQNASLQQSLVTEQLPSDIQFQPVTAITDGVLMLTTGKADALAVSYDNGEMLMKSYPEIAMKEEGRIFGPHLSHNCEKFHWIFSFLSGLFHLYAKAFCQSPGFLGPLAVGPIH